MTPHEVRDLLIHSKYYILKCGNRVCGRKYLPHFSSLAKNEVAREFGIKTKVGISNPVHFYVDES